jgi:hypothetical protein
MLLVETAAMREYTNQEITRANLPYIIMILLGGLTVMLSYEFTVGSIAGALAYLVYGAAGALWIMVFVCPYCAHYGARSCPCGYGVMAARLVRKGERECFPQKFKRHIPVIVPLWIIPPAVGVIALVRAFTWPLFALVCLYALDAYVILPLVSKRDSCGGCPQREICPWTSGTCK